ncbi:hypothetical protein GWI33_009068 [Rhynchophorus ferrugineus]|uniref:Uncharacterized protein n=1 Tax=Rhynchophorus ferrugineus TaxID=354439 RepID=A0A834IFZ9_RHYFE|nr:hypothetical protein GWI33_009068 [Rhynchophorus ferrugineus]
MDDRRDSGMTPPTQSVQSPVRALTENKQLIHPRSVIGRTVSSVSTSFEKRFRILPTGVTSKNSGPGARSILLSKVKCCFLAAFKAPTNRASAAKNITTTENVQKQSDIFDLAQTKKHHDLKEK